MQIKRISCPSCGVVLDVKNGSDATEKIITCPKCNTQLKVKFKPVTTPTEPVEAHTYLGAQKKKPQPQLNNFETQLGGEASSKASRYSSAETRLSGTRASFETQLSTSPKQQATTSNNTNGWIVIKSCFLLYNFREMELSVGRNIVGRKATTSQATIQIPTDDHYMSRQHCCIDITAFNDGTKKAVLRNFQNKNVTFINGQPLESDDIIRLFDGDTIKMGDTILTFKIK